LNSEQITEILLKDLLEWELLTSELDAHPLVSLHDSPSPVWTSRDVYAHLARWMTHSNNNIEAYQVGRSLTLLEGAGDEINARWQKEDSKMSLEEARSKAFKAFERRLHLVRSVPEKRWDEELEKIVCRDGYEHYIAHRSYICLNDRSRLGD
jgi:hypothetical protein